ncbi:hypothetical protein KAI58_03175 [Candidatus Gracilibacteria bacterium]|nr:hypothetical protein [Candidatus Gracilibacteria bacterium]
MKNEIQETGVEVVAESYDSQFDAKDSTNPFQAMSEMFDTAVEKIGVEEVLRLVKKCIDNEKNK